MERLVEAEVDFYIDVDGDGGFAVAHRGLELVFANRFHGFFVEAHAEGTDNVDVLGVALSVDDETDQTNALILGAAGFIRELCLGLEERYRG